jgi:hypothetical protein
MFQGLGGTNKHLGNTLLCAKKYACNADAVRFWSVILRIPSMLLNHMRELQNIVIPVVHVISFEFQAVKNIWRKKIEIDVPRIARGCSRQSKLHTWDSVLALQNVNTIRSEAEA